MPSFSTDNEEFWYYLVFESGQVVVSEPITGSTVITKVAKKDNEYQLWKFIGNAEEFILVNKKNVNSVAFINGYIRSTSIEDAGKFCLVPSSYPSMNDCWEIEYSQKEDEYNRWNQWGGSGENVSIGLYTPGEPNNALKFIREEDLPESPVLETIKEFNVKAIEGYKPEARHTIWFDEPANSSGVSDPWMEYGFPIGNGEFGAMVFGGVAQDRLQFNDKSLWTGSSTSRGSYQNFGDLYIEDISGVFGYNDEGALNNYLRELILPEGRVSVSYASPDGKVSYSREYIASNPDKVVAVNLSSSQGNKMSIRLRLFNGVNLGILVPEYKDGEISFSGRLETIHFKAKVKPVVKGGTVTTKKDCIEIMNADEVMILLAGATNFDIHSDSYTSDINKMESDVDYRITSAESKGWTALLEDHIADFNQYYDRAEFNILSAENDRPTDDIVINYNKRRADNNEPCNLMLEELYYAFGRYLLISSSRGMDLPANLQGIWNHSNTPAWQCDIHSNINVQMNYWPAEITNLSEMHEPYLNYIYSMALDHKEWQEYAKRSGQTEGWTCFTQNNIFGHSDYAENYVIANAWYCSHLWQHYMYTLDKEFLKNKAFPVMASCAKFWLERLVKDSDGTWVAPKEWSPEHGPAEEDATAHAQQILVQLFGNTLEAIEILKDEVEIDSGLVAELKDKFPNLDKGLGIETFTAATGWTSNGLSAGDPILREWKYSDYTAGENGHRHQSHLMAMYPFGNITPESEWFTPAVNSLAQRGDLSTGWSLAWRIALWGRALDGEHAHTIIHSALRHATSYGQSNGAGGIYYNLLDSHAPFQIDGNFGYTAGVTEMLVQSYGGKIRLLPALPSIWKRGSLRGIKAEGGFEIDEEWNNLTLSSATIKSIAGRDCIVNYKGIAGADVKDDKGNAIEIEKLDNDNIKFSTLKDGVYIITFPEETGIKVIETPKNHLKVIDNVAYVSEGEALVKAYDLSGRLLASANSSLDLSPFIGSLLIIKAESAQINEVLKIMVK